MSGRLQVQSSEILAILFNRLACNSIPHAWTPPGRSTGAAVQLTPRGPTLHTPEDLLAALLDIPGARVQMQIVSRITGLGAGVPTPVSRWTETFVRFDSQCSHPAHARGYGTIMAHNAEDIVQRIRVRLSEARMMVQRLPSRSGAAGRRRRLPSRAAQASCCWTASPSRRA